MSTSSNVTIRLPENGGVDRPITYEELDSNFLELKTLIDEYNAFLQNDTPLYQSRIHFEMSKTLFDQQQYFEPGVFDVFTVSGDKLTVPTTTEMYQSPVIKIGDQQISVETIGNTAGGIRVQVKGYDETGTQVTGSSDTDFTINGSNRSFVSSPSYSPVSNSENQLEIIFTDQGKAKASFYTVSIQTSALDTFDFTQIVFRG